MNRRKHDSQGNEVPNIYDGSNWQYDTGIRQIVDHNKDTLFTQQNPAVTSGDFKVINPILPTDSRGLLPLTEPTPMSIPTYDGSGQTTHPSVVFIPRGFNGYRFWMVHTPYPDGDEDYENPSIVVSNDGINWLEPPGITNPLFGPILPGFFSDPHLEYDSGNNKLVMWWQQSELTGLPGRWRSESSDGITWAQEVLCSGIGTSPSVIKRTRSTGGTAEWIGFSPVIEHTQGSVYRSVSRDGGVNFTHSGWVSMNVDGSLGHSWFGLDDMGWHGLLSVSPYNRHWPECQLYYTYSPNGWDWVTFPSPIIGRSLSADSPRSVNVYRSCMVNLGDVVRIYYSATNSSGQWHIGYMDCLFAFDESLFFKGTVTLPVFRNLEIRNTENYVGLYTGYDERMWNQYKHKSIMYTNSHDATLEIGFASTFRGSLGLNNTSDLFNKYNGGNPNAATLDLPEGNIYAPVLVSETDSPLLNVSGIPGGVKLYAKRKPGQPTPTTGQLDLSLVMWND